MTKKMMGVALTLLTAFPEWAVPNPTLAIVTYNAFTRDSAINRPNQVRFLEDPLEQYCRPTPDVVYVDDKFGAGLQSELEKYQGPGSDLALVNTHGNAPDYPLKGFFMSAPTHIIPKEESDVSPVGMVRGESVVSTISNSKNEGRVRKTYMISCHAGHCSYGRADCVSAECGGNQTSAIEAPGWRKLVPLYCDSIGRGNCKTWEKFDVDHDGKMTSKEISDYFAAVSPQQFIHSLTDSSPKHLKEQQIQFEQICRALPNGRATLEPIGFSFGMHFELNSIGKKMTDPWLTLYPKNLPVCTSIENAKKMAELLYVDSRVKPGHWKSCDDDNGTVRKNIAAARTVGCGYLDSTLSPCGAGCEERLVRRNPLNTEDCRIRDLNHPVAVVRAKCEWDGVGLGKSPFDSYLKMPPDMRGAGADAAKAIPKAMSLTLEFPQCLARYRERQGFTQSNEKKQEDAH